MAEAAPSGNKAAMAMPVASMKPVIIAKSSQVNTSRPAGWTDISQAEPGLTKPSQL